ncbi:hypothetical protein NGRA_3178, partial [Nosema granulosis]
VNILVELVDRRNNCLGNHIIHVESTFTSENLQTFLNSLSTEPLKCKFLYNSERFKSSFDEIIGKYKLEIEQKIIIEYEIDEGNNPEESLELDSPIASLRYHDKNLYVSLYFSPVEIYEVKDKLEKKCIKKEIIRSLYYSEDGMLGYKNSYLINLDKENTIIENVEISALLSLNTKIFFGTATGECCCFEDKVVVLYQGKYKVQGIYKNNNGIHFVLENGSIVIFDLETQEIAQRKHDFIVTSFVNLDGNVIYGTSESFIYDTSTKERINVDLRFIKTMLNINSDLLVLTNQYNLVIFNLSTKTTVNILDFQEEINGVVVAENNIIVAAGRCLFRYNLQTLIS